MGQHEIGPGWLVTRVKLGELIRIDGCIELKVIAVSKNRTTNEPEVMLAIDAPRSAVIVPAIRAPRK